MNFAGAYRFVGRTDISHLKSRVVALSETDWNAYGARQKRFEVHKDTSTIPLLYDEDFRHENPTPSPMYGALRNEIEPILTIVRRHYDTSLAARRLQEKNGPAYPIRIILTRLSPGGVIPPHMDAGFSLTHAHRIHLPIVSRETVGFRVDGIDKHLAEGELWEINNRRVHAVRNLGSEARVHLIIDWVIPGQRCCCSARTNPQGKCSPSACATTDNRTEPCACFALT